MWQRLKYLLSEFVVVWAYFVLQKPVFMMCNASKPYALADYLSVAWHGAWLDATTAGYLTAIPFLLLLVSVWWNKLPLRKILTPYYIVVMLLVSTIFVADTSLFAFWESKLDATVFVYLDSPKNAAASVSTLYIVLRVLYIVVLTALMSWLLWRLTPCKLQALSGWGRRMLATVCALPVGGLLFLVIRGGIRVSTQNVGTVYFSSDQYLNLSAINPVFNMFASMEFQKKYEDEFRFYPD